MNQLPMNGWNVFFRILVLVPAIVVGCLADQPAPTNTVMNTKKAITIVAFGDSITQAGHQVATNQWPELLSQALRKKFPGREIRVINAGVGGNTSAEGLRRIEQDVLKHKPDFVTVEFGNDATFEDNRRVSLEDFAKNFELIRTKVAAASGGRLIILTFTPVIDEWHQFRTKEFFKQQGGLDVFQERYRKVTRDYAAAHKLPLADTDLAIRKEMAAHGTASCMLPDGVHLTVRGNQVVAETVLPVLTGEIEKL